MSFAAIVDKPSERCFQLADGIDDDVDMLLLFADHRARSIHDHLRCAVLLSRIIYRLYRSSAAGRNLSLSGGSRCGTVITRSVDLSLILGQLESTSERDKQSTIEQHECTTETAAAATTTTTTAVCCATTHHSNEHVGLFVIKWSKALSPFSASRSVTHATVYYSMELADETTWSVVTLASTFSSHFRASTAELNLVSLTKRISFRHTHVYLCVESKGTRWEY